MQRTEHRAFQTPDEVREFPKGHAEILQVGDAEIGRLVFEPGWRWSESVKPIAETASCEAPHFHYRAAESAALWLERGWRWSESVKPIAETASCEAPHFQYHVAGELAIAMDDGTEFVARPGDVTSLPSGHDAWVVGEEPVVVVDWFGASEYAKG